MLPKPESVEAVAHGYCIIVTRRWRATPPDRWRVCPKPDKTLGQSPWARQDDAGNWRPVNGIYVPAEVLAAAAQVLL